MTEQLAHSQLQFDLPDRMRRALRISDVGVSEMAEYLGVTRTAVSTWINGRITPGKQTLRLWALRTGVPLTWLETGVVPDENDGDDGDGLPRLDSNQQPAGYQSAQVTALRAA